MESNLKKLSNGEITALAKETALAMMNAMGQAKTMGYLKTDEDMLDLMAVGIEEAFTILVENMEAPGDESNSKIIL